jgi:hypothetical protein
MYLKRENSKCAVIGSAGTTHELWFELPDQPNGPADSYSFVDFLEYRSRIHQSISWKEYNGYMDDHIAVFLGMVRGPKYKEWYDLKQHLEKTNVPYLTRGRSQFDTVIVPTPGYESVIQLKFVNKDRQVTRGTDTDHYIPGCKTEKPAEIFRYDEALKSGIPLSEIYKRIGFNVPPDPHYYDAKLSDIYDFCSGPSEQFQKHFEGMFECDAHSLCRPSTSSRHGAS